MAASREDIEKVRHSPSSSIKIMWEGQKAYRGAHVGSIDIYLGSKCIHTVDLTKMPEKTSQPVACRLQSERKSFDCMTFNSLTDINSLTLKAVLFRPSRQHFSILHRGGQREDIYSSRREDYTIPCNTLEHLNPGRHYNLYIRCVTESFLSAEIVEVGPGYDLALPLTKALGEIFGQSVTNKLQEISKKASGFFLLPYDFENKINSAFTENLYTMLCNMERDLFELLCKSTDDNTELLKQLLSSKDSDSLLHNLFKGVFFQSISNAPQELIQLKVKEICTQWMEKTSSDSALTL
ncbi:hypothetical protein Lgee_1950 [Legionella geestiana]|uniref:Uncharacterized protein n=1 Tax=Legionella geestiana TaxID=45065 RepID=A0A0W0TNZ8_9GAMM|nr:hypothetical protein [Legionella geestiana]KTC97289.1 hypothetical protein Lgee_1950 [Legionella geestiana]QBS12417.1 hypothetical protein E4T54_06465 [Legionella geestiana]STX55142.1 Uncharacterised protein [Legionella geestiana]